MCAKRGWKRPKQRRERQGSLTRCGRRRAGRATVRGQVRRVGEGGCGAGARWEVRVRVRGAGAGARCGCGAGGDPSAVGPVDVCMRPPKAASPHHAPCPPTASVRGFGIPQSRLRRRNAWSLLKDPRDSAKNPRTEAVGGQVTYAVDGQVAYVAGRRTGKQVAYA